MPDSETHVFMEVEFVGGSRLVYDQRYLGLGRMQNHVQALQDMLTCKKLYGRDGHGMGTGATVLGPVPSRYRIWMGTEAKAPGWAQWEVVGNVR